MKTLKFKEYGGKLNENGKLYSHKLFVNTTPTINIKNDTYSDDGFVHNRSKDDTLALFLTELKKHPLYDSYTDYLSDNIFGVVFIRYKEKDLPIFVRCALPTKNFEIYIQLTVFAEIHQDKIYIDGKVRYHSAEYDENDDDGCEDIDTLIDTIFITLMTKSDDNYTGGEDEDEIKELKSDFVEDFVMYKDNFIKNVEDDINKIIKKINFKKT